jgi:3alpha(or 20beta)-hydroxysteroid dehydrogenase
LTPEHDFRGSTIVVTGALGAMGRTQVTRLADAGARVHALDLPAPDADGWSALTAGPGDVVPHSVDVRSEESWLRLLSELGDEPLHGLVNFAGVTLRSPLTQTELADWERVMGINVTGSFLAIKSLSTLLVEGASIVNLSSSAGITGYFGAAYSASKWAIRGLTRSAAMELGHRGIRVNSVCPGIVDSPMTRNANAVYNADQAATFYEACTEATLNGRGASVEEITQAIEFLLSEASRYINAADLPVDAGMVATSPYQRVGTTVGTLRSAAPESRTEGEN